MNNPLQRGPDGKFVGWGGELKAWFSVLMGHGNSLQDLLVLASRYCDQRAGEEMRQGADCLKRGEASSQSSAEYCIGLAQRWFRRKEVLIAANDQLWKI